MEMETRSMTKKQKIIVEPRLKPIKYKLNDLNFNKITKTKVTIDGDEFYSLEDNPLNKRGYKYKPCKPNKLFKSTLYSTTEIAPFKIRPSYFDKSQGIVFDDDLLVSNKENGWRSIRSNIGVSKGDWYVEFKIIKTGDNDHVRIGFARKEASLEAPIGFDGYGYGLRDVTGQKITLSRPKSFMEEGFGTGDIIGFRIILPTEESDEVNLIRDQIPIKYKNSLYYEQFEYTKTETMAQLLNPVKIFGEKLTKLEKFEDLPTIPGSKIIVYKNGKEMGTMFENLYSFNFSKNLEQSSNPHFKHTNDGTLGYYPMISIFNNAIVEMNASAVPPVPECKPLNDRYEEFVVEEYFWDLMDEVENCYLDDLEKME